MQKTKTTKTKTGSNEGLMQIVTVKIYKYKTVNKMTLKSSKKSH